jgi:hypothetical protein
MSARATKLTFLRLAAAQCGEACLTVGRLSEFPREA